MSGVQSQFRAALLDPERSVPEGLVGADGQPTEKRFAVYRNNVTVALTEALRSAFPVLEKLLGDENFASLARLYARAHPPRTPMMMHYGVDMPEFLAAFQPLAHIGYLPDVAHLELAMRRAYHAGDVAPFDAERLSQITPDRLMASTLRLAPAVQLVPSQWPLFDIWRYNMQAGADKPRAIAQPVLVARRLFDPAPFPLTTAQAAWVAATQDGNTLAGAQDAAASIDPDFDLTPLLTLLLQQGCIADITTPKD
ncbi:DNA-binding domain-containing protein [uncultured Tateyamaria sp.]|uniref:HvfC/BufC N-terminal domain-containing protein n=1 Tax=uncultured Tateyamaria sp. TaxID=455651 RepID=UPI00260F734A|nr:DNA-binding domain-containing protein [uncultured Tateyamaria sp.]